MALDIKGFFESLDHARLKDLWCRLLGVNRLPPDHFQVFKAITQYAFVEKELAYERLGLFGTKVAKNGGPPIKGYLVPLREIPKQLCRGKEFREKICGGSGLQSIVNKNPNPFGIPQGAPISDLLANIYLLDFDRTVARWVADFGGAYYRYSDDILILVPGGKLEGFDLLTRTCKLIQDFGSELQIQEAKASLVVFESEGNHQRFELIHGKQGRNGLEYLGFRYDGQSVFLRDATLSNLYRKITRAANREASSAARRYPDKRGPEIRKLINFEELIRKFGRVEGFNERNPDFRNCTFWTYAMRAAKVFGSAGNPILHQLRNHRAILRRRLERAIDRAVIRRDRQRSKRKSVGSSATDTRNQPGLS